MNPILTLIRVTPADAALLDRLWQFYELESSFWSGEDIDETGRFTSLDDFLERLGTPDPFDWAYLIRHEGQLAGLLLVGHQNLRGQSIMEFCDLYVLPRFRGRGIATELIADALDDLRERGTRITVLCPVVSAFIANNPAYADLADARHPDA